ncbi:MAG TPA: hypothetical protein VK463_04500 [Desulfomonilaceae bacterium]|nr:hypothetical protein [Desulfomonilaceae bacterium]
MKMVVNIRSVIKDIEVGLSHEEIKTKHKMSDRDLAQLYAASHQVDEFIDTTVLKLTQGEVLFRRTDCLDRIYELAHLASEDKRRIDLERHVLRVALKNGMITVEEFRQRLSLLIQDLLEKI